MISLASEGRGRAKLRQSGMRATSRIPRCPSRLRKFSDFPVSVCLANECRVAAYRSASVLPSSAVLPAGRRPYNAGFFAAMALVSEGRSWGDARTGLALGTIGTFRRSAIHGRSSTTQREAGRVKRGRQPTAKAVGQPRLFRRRRAQLKQGRIEAKYECSVLCFRRAAAGRLGQQSNRVRRRLRLPCSALRPRQCARENATRQANPERQQEGRHPARNTAGPKEGVRARICSISLRFPNHIDSPAANRREGSSPGEHSRTLPGKLRIPDSTNVSKRPTPARRPGLKPARFDAPIPERWREVAQGNCS